MKNIKKILLADDHSIVARGLHFLIMRNFQDCQIGEVYSLQELMQRLPKEKFTHLILDLNLEDGNSFDVLPEIIKNYPDLAILIYSMASEEVFGLKLMQYGISGFLSKKSSEQEIVRAIQVVLQGGIFVSRHLRRVMETTNSGNEAEIFFQRLSFTELRVLGFLLRGLKTKEIAGELGVTQQTVATFKSRIFKKLGTENVLEIQKLAKLHNMNFS